MKNVNQAQGIGKKWYQFEVIGFFQTEVNQDNHEQRRKQIKKYPLKRPEKR